MLEFYADEDFPGPVIVELRTLGYSVLTVQKDGRAGNSDELVLLRAMELGRVVLTKNRLDFYKLHAIYPKHFGIIVIRDDSDRVAIAMRIQKALQIMPIMVGQLIRINRPHPSEQNPA